VKRGAIPPAIRVLEECRVVAEFADGEIDREHALNCLLRIGMGFTEASEALDLIEEKSHAG
jgi:hypothetical protein